MASSARLRLAMFSDLHGNVPALQAILADIRRTGPYDLVACLGDFLNKGPGASDMVHALRRNCDIVLSGNHEQYILNGDPAAIGNPSGDELSAAAEVRGFVRSRLTASEVDWIAGLPALQVLDTAAGRILLCHGSEADNTICPYPGIPAARLRSLFPNLRRYAVVAHGHDHGAKVHRMGLRTFINVSSGSQSYDDRPLARYVGLEVYPEYVACEFHTTLYDADDVAARVADAGLSVTAARLMRPHRAGRP